MPERLQPATDKGRYRNPEFHRGDGTTFRDFLKWRRERRGLAPDAGDVPCVEPVGNVPHGPREGVVATWAGHSSTLLQLDGRTFLLDPVWSTRLAGVVKRMTPVGLAWEALPPVDALVISHDHYDHLDVPTVQRLPRETPVLCPVGIGRWFERRGFTRVVERAWWEEADLDGHRAAFVPAQHFSGRTLWDRDRTLWGGWVLEGDRGSRVYFAGDTGYFGGFRQIGEAFPDIDLALIPIGAYEPRWFMSPVHVGPAEAGQAFLDVGARHMLPIHWGAFRLADEPVGEPPHVLRAWWTQHGLEPSRLSVPALGERVEVPPRPRQSERPSSSSSSPSMP